MTLNFYFLFFSKFTAILLQLLTEHKSPGLSPLCQIFNSKLLLINCKKLHCIWHEQISFHYTYWYLSEMYVFKCQSELWPIFVNCKEMYSSSHISALLSNHTIIHMTAKEWDWKVRTHVLFFAQLGFNSKLLLINCKKLHCIWHEQISFHYTLLIFVWNVRFQMSIRVMAHFCQLHETKVKSDNILGIRI
jgi:hypothetical protein